MTKTLHDHSKEQIENLNKCNHDFVNIFGFGNTGMICSHCGKQKGLMEEVILNRVVPTGGTSQDKFNKLGNYKITLIQRKDEWKHWRLFLFLKGPFGFNEDYEYVIEQPTIDECLDRAIRYIETGEV